MRLPRWTVWPALATLALFLVPAIPGRARDPYAGAAERARALAASPPAPASAPRKVALPPARDPRLIVLGIDGMDPEILRETLERFPELTPNLRWLVERGGLHALGTSCPPQSPVAWSNFITGLDPGGHGIFDFIHRDLATRGTEPSTTTPVAEDTLELPGEWSFPLSSGGESNRTGKAFWERMAEAGVAADIWRMPANFPVVAADGLSFSGMMTPALDSAYGEFTLYTTDPPVAAVSGGKLEPVRQYDGRILTRVIGPANPFKDGHPPVTVPITVHVDRQAKAAAIDTGERVVVVPVGGWSEFVELDFPFLPSFLGFVFDLASYGTGSVKGVVRFYLRSIEPEFEMYASPVNIDPLSPPAAAPVSQPDDASAQVADAIGIYYTQGMPEDVNALKARVLDDEEFMQQSSLVHAEGLRMLDWALARFVAKPEGGLLFFYFSGVDLCGHMMWRHFDAQHPHHDEAFAQRDSSRWSGRPGSEWKDVIYDLYLHVDDVVGRVRAQVGDDVRLVLMSDHGFAPYRRKFSLNTWLLEQGYLVLKEGRTRELPYEDPAHQRVFLVDAVDWSRTRAYGVGFNGLYLNLAGRERDDPHTPEDESGIVSPEQAPALLAELREKLLACTDGDAHPILRCDFASEVYHGARTPEAPDILVGYDSGYGNSDPASLGRIPNRVLEDNLGGTFNGSHLMAPEVVPGVLLTNGRVLPGEHRLEDLTVEILRQYGIQPGAGMRGHPVLEW